MSKAKAKIKPALPDGKYGSISLIRDPVCCGNTLLGDFKDSWLEEDQPEVGFSTTQFAAGKGTLITNVDLRGCTTASEILILCREALDDLDEETALGTIIFCDRSGRWHNPNMEVQWGELYDYIRTLPNSVAMQPVNNPNSGNNIYPVMFLWSDVEDE